MPTGIYKRTKIHNKNISKSVSGKNHWNYGNKKPKPKCIKCNKEISRYAKQCNSCAKKEKNKFNLTKQNIEQLYIKDKKSVHEISKKFGCYPTLVYYYFKIFNIQRRTISESLKLSHQKYPFKHSGKTSPNYKDGRTNKPNFCVDCGKRISRNAKRCGFCSKKIKGKNHWNWKGGNPKCIDCGIQLKGHSRKSQRCASCTMKHKWQNKEYRNKVIKASLIAQKIKPNKPEKLLNKLLSKLFPKEYKYVGDGKVVMNGFNPDFINCNGKKKIIELYGDYWHNRKDAKGRDKYRLENYRRLGYKTLIIWEHELKDLDKVANRIIEFNYE